MPPGTRSKRQAGHVKKGAKSEIVTFWKLLKREGEDNDNDNDSDSDSDSDEVKQIPFPPLLPGI